MACMRRILLAATVVFSTASVPGGALRVTGGITDHQVLQRNGEGRAPIACWGKAQGVTGGGVEARVMRGQLPLAGLDWQNVGTISNGDWRAEIPAVPAGGPYRVDVRAAGEPEYSSVHDVLVGDLWVLAGQSNMQGVGDLIDVEPPHALVHNFDMAHQWATAEEPLHTLVSARNPVHWPRNAKREPEKFDGERLRKFLTERRKGSGLGLPFAARMVERTGVPIGLLACAHGGTSMDQWDPALKEKGGESLYGSMLMRIREAGGKVTGVLWYQGESDANPKAAPAFQEKFERFIAAVRGDTGDPNLPFYYVQIGRHVNRSGEAEWNLVQDAQRKVEAAIPRSAVVAAIDTDLDDSIHVSTPDLKRLGARLANLACHDLFPHVAGCASYRRGPRPVAATVSGGTVRVTFAEVNGRLVSRGRVSGFSIHGADGAPLPLIYKARVDPGNPDAVLLSIGGKLAEGAVLRYGYGKDPYCNLRDEADMAAPVFGPLPIQAQ